MSGPSLLQRFLPAALEQMAFRTPTPIQKKVLPALCGRSDVLFGAETGSGKTFAFLLPLFAHLKASEERGVQTAAQRPRGLVVVPSRELLHQTTQVAKALSHVMRLRVRAVSSHRSAASQRALFEQPIDVLITTPARLLDHQRQRNVFLSGVTYAAFDEADLLVDRGFREELDAIVRPLLSKRGRGEPPCQFAFCGATLTKPLINYTQQRFGSKMKTIVDNSLHKAVIRAKQQFIPVDKTNKDKTLLKVLKDLLAKDCFVILFCNSVNSARFVDHYLNENDISCASLHGSLPPAQRQTVMQQLLASKKGTQTKPFDVLVATDVASRGLDLTLDNVAVVCFDFPLSPSDYLHRAGRTARNGASGTVVSLVRKRDSHLADQIQAAAKRNNSLTDVEIIAPSMYGVVENELSNLTAH